MINPARGEVGLVIDGQERVMRLTLGALAALEAELGESSLSALVGRFESGDFAASDLIQLLWAGLNGGGWDVSLADIKRAEIAGGPVGAAKAAARLLHLTFASTPP